MITQAEQNVAATKFANDWRNIGDEKSDSQRYWIEFFTNVLGIENVTQKIIEAGKLVGLLYDGLLEQYIDPGIRIQYS